MSIARTSRFSLSDAREAMAAESISSLWCGRNINALVTPIFRTPASLTRGTTAHRCGLIAPGKPSAAEHLHPNSRSWGLSRVILGRAATHEALRAATTSSSASTQGEGTTSPLGMGLLSSEGTPQRDPFSAAEWAGWECKFSGRDGSRQAVPEDYVPESLSEWGVEVWGFETFTSERRQSRPEDSEAEVGREAGGDAKDASSLYRKRARVFPEVGCALDNLSLEVNELRIPLDDEGVFPAAFEGGSYLLAKKAKDRRSLQVEVGLYLDKGATLASVIPQGTSSARPPKDEDDAEEIRSRLEFCVDGDGPDNCRVGPVNVTRERKYARHFDGGLLYKGGGLDAQRVGRLLKCKCFAEEDVAPTCAELAGQWIPGWAQRQLSTDGHSHMTAGSLQPEHVQPIDRPESFWTSGGGGPDLGDASISSPALGLLLRGGYTLRVGSFPSICGTTPPETSGVSFLGSGDAKGFPELKEAWAVEVGWLVANGKKREVLLVALDLSSMSPLGAWRSIEERFPR